jgi:hypothetical protein
MRACENRHNPGGKKCCSKPKAHKKRLKLVVQKG